MCALGKSCKKGSSSYNRRVGLMTEGVLAFRLRRPFSFWVLEVYRIPKPQKFNKDAVRETLSLRSHREA